MQSSDAKVVLEAIAILEISAASGPLAPFEFSLAGNFIKRCMVTAFPDTRQKMMKTITAFLIRIRCLLVKDIRRYDPTLAETNPELHAVSWAPLEEFYSFLDDILTYAEENLYLDKPIEGAFPLFDIIKLVMDLFGNNQFYLNKSKQFEAINFLAKAKEGHLLSSKSLFMFFINSLKSSWTNVRLNAFELLSKYSCEFASFHDSDFVNGILVTTALDFLNDPRAMMAEASALMLKLAFTKCINVIDLGKFGAEMPAEFANDSDKQLAFLQAILQMIKTRLHTFKSSLISEGKTTALIHGLLSFFKHVFTDFTLGDLSKLEQEKFLKWRVFYKDVLHTSLDISKVCANLLSNNRVTDDGEDAVDCRGHPISQAATDGSGAKGGEDGAFDDYDNLVLVGIWLAVKENGETL